MTTENLCVALSQYKLIEITGADAEKYLQGQLTCDVAKLGEQQHTLTAHCDPKGKMSGLFRLYRHSAEQFFAIIRQDLLPEALVQLKKYAVFSKVNFTELAQPIFGTTSGQIAENFKASATILTLAGSPTRHLFWGEISPENLAINGEPSQWDLLEIQQGEPILLKANQFELIPQAANLQMLEQAISFTKGCYIGQETVARAKYRGANKRAMFTLVGEAENEPTLPEIGGSVELQLGDNWKQTGTILQAIYAENRLWVQVVLNKEIETTATFRVNGVNLTIYPLPYEVEA